MAQRHKDVLHITSHPYGTQEVVGYLWRAQKEVELEVLADYLPDDDIDFGTLIDYTIEKDAACQLLAYHIYYRMSCEALAALFDKYQAALGECTEEANG